MLQKEQPPAVAQLEALSRVSNRLGATLLLDEILNLVLLEAVQNSNASCGEILLLDENQGIDATYTFPGPAPATPRLNEQVIERKSAHVYAVASLLEPAQAREQLHFALIAPVLFESRVSGLIRLISADPNGFADTDLTFVSALTDLTALAVGNALRFSELRERNTLLQRRTQQIEHFLESSRVFHSERRLEEVYEELVYAIQEGVGYNVVLLSLVENTGQGMSLRRVTAAGLPIERLKEIQKTPQSWQEVEKLFSPNFRLGGAYFIARGTSSAEGLGLSVPHVGDLYRSPLAPNRTPLEKLWNEADLFFIPLRDMQGKPQGLISLASPIDGLRPDLNTARVLEVFANQAASAIENVQLFHNMWDYALQLQQLHNVSQQTLRERDFDRQLEIILDGLQIAGWQRVTLTLRDEAFKVTKLISAGLSTAEHDALEHTLLPAAIWRQRFGHETLQQYRRGNCYFVPDDDPRTRPAVEAVFPAAAQPETDERWSPGGVLYRPLFDREQQLIGLLALASPDSHRHPDENGLQTIDLYAQFAISVIESHRMFSEMQRRSQELQALFDASKALSGTLKQDAILTAMGEHMLQAVSASAYTVYALTRNRRDTVVLRSESKVGWLDEEPAGTQSQIRQVSLAQKVIETRRAAAQDFSAPSTGAGAEQGERFSLAMLPLPLGDELFGLVEVIATNSQFNWTPDKLQLLEAIANQASTALETAHLVEELDDRVAQRTRALAEEVARVQSILESMADGVLVAEADGTILMANMPTAQYFDLPQERLVGQPVEKLKSPHGNGADRWANTVRMWSTQSASLQPHGAVKDQIEVGARVLNVHVSPVFANGHFFGTISIFRDITREAEVDRMKSEFVSTVSHELRTPMTSIKGYTDLLLMGAAGEVPEPQHRFLEVIRKNADRLTVLVDDLLDISRIETGKTDLKLQPVDVSRIIQHDIGEHVRGRIQHENKALNFSISLEPPLPPVHADPEKVTRILMNLVDNAINYTPDGGTIEVQAFTSAITHTSAQSEKGCGDMVCIRVRDSGVGISRENIERIFERFYRVEGGNFQDAPGTGLGLPIVRSLVEMHGGEISVESEPGVGSTFTFSLPCVNGDKHDLTEISSASSYDANARKLRT